MYGPYTGSRYAALAGTAEGYTEADFAAALKQLHGLAASIADSKRRYQETGDARYLQSVQSVLPLYREWLTKAHAINRALTSQDMPSSFMLFLSDVGGWLEQELASAYAQAKKTSGDVLDKVPKVFGSLPWIALGAVALVAVVFSGKIGKR